MSRLGIEVDADDAEVPIDPVASDGSSVAWCRGTIPAPIAATNITMQVAIKVRKAPMAARGAAFNSKRKTTDGNK
jgi:hypothetical protein